MKASPSFSLNLYFLRTDNFIQSLSVIAIAAVLWQRFRYCFCYLYFLAICRSKALFPRPNIRRGAKWKNPEKPALRILAQQVNVSFHAILKRNICKDNGVMFRHGTLLQSAFQLSGNKYQDIKDLGKITVVRQ